MNTVVIVSGAAGPVGKAFMDALAAYGYDCIGISRRPIDSPYQIKIADLANAKQTMEAVGTIETDKYERIIFVHTVGSFKFEPDGKPVVDCDNDGIDDEVYHSNVDTFKHVVDALTTCTDLHQRLIISSIGSISDQFGIRWWNSYSRAKNAVREMMRSLAQEERISCISLNVSTVKTGKECALRPCADMTYWLTPEELAERATVYLAHAPDGYLEVPIYEPMPSFDPVAYHLDAVAIRERWMREMGK